MKNYLLAILCMLAVVFPGSARRNQLRTKNPEFFTTSEAMRIGEQVLIWQRITGGWPKNVDMVTPMTSEKKAEVLAEKGRRDDSTTDNNATTTQMDYLARLYHATGDVRYRDAVREGGRFLLGGQYPNGGWPQFWPEMKGYQIHITYNDGAMINTMRVIRNLACGKEPYTGDIIDPSMKECLDAAFRKGVECILATQIVNGGGELTVWCQQHDRETLLPAPARAYELPSYCSAESADIVALLMELPDPDERVKRAIHSAMKWFDKYKLTGLKVIRNGGYRNPASNVRLVEDPSAGPIWSRYYDLEHCEPYVCDRDGVPRRHLEQIGYERRNGYGWFSDNPSSLFDAYDRWADHFDPEGKVDVSLETPGANRNGTIDMNRKPLVDPSLFDVVVTPGESLQNAIDKAPEIPTQPFKILVRKGLYNQKVIIDRPNIVLVGEDRDSTILFLAERNGQQLVKEYNGKPVGNGVIVIQEGADDCVISGMTVYNNYGTTVENTTTHQMAVFGRATRTIIINSIIKADGNDALSLWARGGGLYYHADLDIICRGVDFLCPRGTCFATRCRFEGDGHALIWHDGRGDQNYKLVITDSDFDSRTPAPLGRYHHDSQFYLLNCRMSSMVNDADIAYAYTDKVLDPCPWGKRVYYHGCYREGGHSGWLDDNLKDAPGSPDDHAVTAIWTFDGKWNPEQRIRELWNVLMY